ncbi:MAG: hypothetical protein Q6L60_04105 [Thermostichus sp. HHBFW_bins_43]
MEDLPEITDEFKTNPTDARSQGTEKVQTWLAAVRNHAGQRSIIDSLQTYLSMLGARELNTCVHDLTVGVPEEPFKYQYAYGKDQMSETRDPPQEPGSSDVAGDTKGCWDEIPF